MLQTHNKKYMDIKISPTGEVTIETHGTHGAECEKQINLVMATLGGSVSERKNKPEYFDGDEQPVFAMNKVNR